MKNQYFGDINDYTKYGLLRALSNGGEIRTAVCWMLTADDGRGDGRFIDYLREPQRWRAFDSTLFDSLARSLNGRRRRDVRWVRTTGVIPGARFCEERLTDEAGERGPWFTRFLRIAAGSDLVFFDPDNGLEVTSVPYGTRGSGRYLYRRELLATFRAGHSVLVYQHFPRVRRERFTKALAKELSTQTGAPEVISFRTSRVVLLLVPQSDCRDYFRARSDEVRRIWDPHIATERHTRAR